MFNPQGPHSHIIMMGERGFLTEGYILHPNESQLQNLYTQKIPTFLAYPKESHTSK